MTDTSREIQEPFCLCRDEALGLEAMGALTGKSAELLPFHYESEPNLLGAIDLEGLHTSVSFPSRVPTRFSVRGSRTDLTALAGEGEASEISKGLPSGTDVLQSTHEVLNPATFLSLP